MPEERKYIVEVGVGTKPFPTQGKRRMERDEAYIGIDTDDLALVAKYLGRKHKTGKESLDLAKDRIDQRLAKRRRYHLMYADGTSLPFSDQSISEVVFVNVFGYYGIPIEEAEETTPKMQSPLLIIEASRVLKPKGLVTVAETLTPNKSPFLILNELMKISGFKCLTSLRNIESRKSILEYTENPFLRPDLTPTTYHPNRPYVARFQKSQELRNLFPEETTG